MPSPPPAVIADRDSGGLKHLGQLNTRDRTRTATGPTLVTAALARHIKYVTHRVSNAPHASVTCELPARSSCAYLTAGLGDTRSCVTSFRPRVRQLLERDVDSEGSSYSDTTQKAAP